jgi:hypothetical protein
MLPVAFFASLFASFHNGAPGAKVNRSEPFARLEASHGRQAIDRAGQVLLASVTDSWNEFPKEFERSTIHDD